MIPFDLLKSPLQGAHLIEAGAGTGKTYAIAGLYVRLILERAIPVGEILVVTFTLAATAELKDRIRRKLREALDAFSHQESKDAFLRSLVEARPDPASRWEARERLRSALRDFDESAIFTIHGFCGRMLSDHAFESGALYDTELVTDQRRIQKEIVEDFWRIHFYEALPELVEYALSQGFSPASLLSRMGSPALNPDIRVIPDGPPPSPDAVRGALTALRAAVADLRVRWPAIREEVRQKLQDPALKANIYGPKTANRLVEAMDGWLASGAFQPFKGFEKMTADGLAKALRKDASPPEHPVFQACRDILEKALALLDMLDADLLFLQAELIRTMRTELPARKLKQNLLYFDDLLLRLREALEKEGGAALVTAIRNRFKAALIDEFQDTDPVQYAIFHQLFGDDDHTLFLIGDPKQAIYGFRGADIFAYMQAARAIRTGHTLDWNWRSEPDLVTAVNTLFSGTDNPFVYADISFRPAQAADIAGRDFLTFEGKREPPMQMWFIPAGRYTQSDKSLSKEAARSLIAVAVAAEISRLIGLGREHRALIGRRRLEEGDVAVLVRTNREARLIQRALQALRIASVLASEENVFDSHEALELFLVLQALVWPASERLVCGALATDMLGIGSETLEKWQHDASAWSTRLETFRQDHELWRTRGFMHLFRTLTDREGVRSRLLAFPDGERRLTNLLHLSEILHHEAVARRLDSGRLLQWLGEQLRSEGREHRDDHLLRLESDANTVKILTIHKSKGLEYPILFCPFAWGSSRIGRDPFPFHDIKHHRALTLDLGSADRHTNRILAEKERLAENCRLLYVALTRAKHRCYLVWGRINETGTSAPAWLFHNRSTGIPGDGFDDTVGNLDKRTATLTDRAMQDDLAPLVAGSGGTIRFREMDTTSGVPVPPRPEEPDPPACRLFRGRIDPSWKVASYSLLVSTPSAQTEGPDRDALALAAPLSLSELPDDFPLDAPSVETAAGRIDQNIFHLPGGARTGILVHDILEQFDFTENNPDVIRRLIAGKLPLYGLDREWEETLTRMLRNIAACPLPQPDMAEAEAGGVPPLMLSRIKKTARLNELEFYFPLKLVSRERLHELFGRSGLEETGLERLNFNPVEGFMHGFIDLVFAYEGRYYLADWKSNILGPGIADYAPAALKKAMAAYGYTLQSRLYAVALHQYLRLRIKDYRYDRHFGGIYYLFVRGMDPAYGPACGIHAERPDRHFMDRLCRLLIAEE
jgi:exodeoxyribonuclease V beta subunit